MTPRGVLEVACARLQVSPRLMVGPNRTRNVCKARFLVMKLMREYARTWEGGEVSLPRIGEILGRDHTSILHGLKRADEILSENQNAQALYDDIAHVICEKNPMLFRSCRAEPVVMFRSVRA